MKDEFTEMLSRTQEEYEKQVESLTSELQAL